MFEVYLCPHCQKPVIHLGLGRWYCPQCETWYTYEALWVEEPPVELDEETSVLCS